MKIHSGPSKSNEPVADRPLIHREPYRGRAVLAELISPSAVMIGSAGFIDLTSGDVGVSSIVAGEAGWTILDSTTLDAQSRLLQASNEFEVKTLEKRLKDVLGYEGRFVELCKTVETLQQRIEELSLIIRNFSARLGSPELSKAPSSTFIRSFEDGITADPPLPVTLVDHGEEFEALFLEANVSGYGDTEIEAIQDLKHVIIETLSRFEELGEAKLGNQLKSERAVLLSYFRR